MEGPRDLHTNEVSQKEGDKHHIWYHLYVEPRTNDTNELIYEKETDSQT